MERRVWQMISGETPLPLYGKGRQIGHLPSKDYFLAAFL
jgi:hypothetical protein